MVALTTIIVKHGSMVFLPNSRRCPCHRIVKRRRGFLLWPLVGPTRATARMRQRRSLVANRLDPTRSPRYSKSGDRKTAAAVAARIDLAKRGLCETSEPTRFKCRSPRSWGQLYEFTGFYTAGTYSRCIESAADVASAAMAFSQAIGLEPTQSYGILFNDIDAGEIVQALARAHAASGDANESLAWAEQIGSGASIKADNDNALYRAANRRIRALIGVAEGILDRTSGPAEIAAVRYSAP
jgi:hypothetical protein